MLYPLRPRGENRLPDAAWEAIVLRVRGEFDEMPCLRVTPEQARLLFGFKDPHLEWVLTRLADEGFLVRTDQGEYIRNR